MAQRTVSIQHVSNETKEAVKELGLKELGYITGEEARAAGAAPGEEIALEGRMASPGFKRIPTRWFEVEVVLGPKEIPGDDPDNPGSRKTYPVRILHINSTEDWDATDRFKLRASEVISEVMRKELRIEPGRQDFESQWIATMRSICITVTGLESEPEDEVTDRLARIGLLIAGRLGKELSQLLH